MTFIKCCGMTRIDDVRLAGELGVDAIGLIFASRSARRVDLERAQLLRASAAPALKIVALLMDNAVDDVGQIAQALQPDLLQFHGDEDDGFCAQFGAPFWKALPMHDVSRDAVPELLARYPSASGFVFDGHAPGEMGGSGERFDWASFDTRQRADGDGVDKPWLLAGGLNASNVAQAISLVQPWGVDVSSGIEFAPGIKDHAKMRAFVDAVRVADQPLSPARLPHE
ncbi:MAG: phosphoribosylanthranilate isomerase [Lysobacteraceae bacterium]